jgi:flagellar FliL protein
LLGSSCRPAKIGLAIGTFSLLFPCRIAGKETGMNKPASQASDGRKPSGKKKLLIIAVAVLLLASGGAGAWFSGFLPKLLGKSDQAAGTSPLMEPEKHAQAAKPEHGAAKPQPPAKPEHGAAKPEAGAHGTKPEAPGISPFMDLPDIVANLNAGPRRTSFVKLRVKLELAKPGDQAAVQAVMPRVLDLFQGYLREMRPEELRGSGGTYRLREELLARTNLATAPARVVAVLFTEMLIQ